MVYGAFLRCSIGAAIQGSANAGHVAVVVAARVCVTAAAVGVLRHHVADVVPDEGVSAAASVMGVTTRACTACMFCRLAGR